MNKILLPLFLAVIVSVVCLIGASESYAAQPSALRENPPCAAAKFKTLNRYKSNWSRVFSDAQVAPALRALLKKDYQKLKDSLAEATLPDDSSYFVDNNGVLAVEGGVPGLYTVTEAKLIVEPCGNIYAAIVDAGDNILYYTNDRKYAAKIPKAIESWRLDLERRRGENQSEKPVALEVLYKSR